MSDCVLDHPGGSLLLVRVVPGASKAEVVGDHGDQLKVRVCSPPVDGRANEELVRLLAAALDLRVRDLEVIAGHSARSKRLVIALPAQELRRRVRTLIGTRRADER